MLWLLEQPDAPFTEEEQYEAVRKHQAAALYDAPEELKLRAAEILADMKAHYSADADASELIVYEQDKLFSDRNSRAVNYYQL